MCNDLWRASNYLFFFLTHVILIMAQPKGYIYDESKVPIYDLPEILKEEIRWKNGKPYEESKLLGILKSMIWDAPVFSGKIMHKIVEQGSQCIRKKKTN